MVNAGLDKLTGQAMAPAVVSAAWKNMRFTVDPLSSTLKKEAADTSRPPASSTPVSSSTASTT